MTNQQKIQQLESQWLAVFNKLFNIFKQYEFNTVDQLNQKREVIDLRAELQEIKDKIKELQLADIK